MEFDNIDFMLTKDKKKIKENAKLGRPKKLDKQEKRIVTYLTQKEYDNFKKLRNLR